MVQASRSRDFTDSMAIEPQMKYQYQIGANSPYFNTTNVLAMLDYFQPRGRGTGMNLIRETTLDNRPFSIFLNWGSLGYKFVMGYFYADQTSNALTTDERNKINQMVSSGYVRWVESPNEVNNFGPDRATTGPTNYFSPLGGVYNGADAVAHYQIDCWNFFHSTATKIAGWSIGDQSTGLGLNNNKYQQACRAAGFELNQIMDAGNAHVYTFGGYAPGDPGGGGAYMDFQVAQNCGANIALGQRNCITETGLIEGARNGKFGNPYSNAVYVPQIYLHGFKSGLYFTTYYELADNSPDDGSQETIFGLFYSNGFPKAAAYSLRNMIWITSETGATATTFAPGSLNYTISNLQSPGEHMLLAKANGTAIICIWPNKSIYVNGVYTAAPQYTLNVDLGAVFPTINRYDPLVNATSTAVVNNANWVANTVLPAIQQTWTNQQLISFTMGDGPQFIVIPNAFGATANVPTPTGLTTSGTTASSITLNWNSVTGTGVTYIPQRALQGSTTYTSLAATASASATFTGLRAGTAYDFRVIAVIGGAQSAASATITATTAVPTPAGLTTTGITATSVGLTWTAVPLGTSESPSGTQVTAAGQPGITNSVGEVWTLVTGPAGSGLQIAVNGTVDPLTQNVVRLLYTNHLVWQQIADGRWWSKSQASDLWIPTAGTTTAPTVVPDVTYIPQWAAQGSNTFTTLPETASTAASFTGLTPGVAYQFRVVAVIAGTQSAPSAVATASTLGSAVAAPTGLTTSGITASAVTLSWTAVSTGTSESPSGTQITAAGQPAIINSFGESWTLVDGGAGIGLQVAVGGVIDTNTLSVQQLLYAGHAVWQQNVDGLWWSKTRASDLWSPSAGTTTAPTVTPDILYLPQSAPQGSGTFSPLAQTPTTSATFTGLTSGTTYQLRVIAIVNGIQSAPSATVNATTLGTAVPTPTGLVTSGITTSAVTLSWAAVTGTGVTYIPQRALQGTTTTTPGPGGSPITSLAETAALQATFTGLTANTAYDFRVIAKIAGVQSAPSAIVTATTLASVPSGSGTITPTAAPTPILSVQSQSVITVPFTGKPLVIEIIPGPAAPPTGGGTVGTLTGGVPIPAGYALVFDDYFQGITLDRSKWVRSVTTAVAGVSYATANASVAGGALTIAIAKSSAGAWSTASIDTKPNAWTPPYLVRFRARMDKGKGTDVVLAIKNSDEAVPGELVEVLRSPDSTRASASFVLHWNNNGADATNPGTSPVDVSAYHDYVVVHTGTLMRFYIDGSLVKEITTNLPIKPAYLLIAGYIGQPGDVVRGVPDSTTPNPTKIQVTHVEVWRPGT
jgi:hypothetical protein